jgi:hypothetical protein
MNLRKPENSGPSTGFVTSGRPIWSTTMRPAISISSSFGVKSTSRLTKLNRTPRTPA